MSPNTLLVPIDFSPGSRRALEVAIDLARPVAAKIHLVHAYHVVTVPAVPAVPTPGLEAQPIEIEARQRASDEIDAWFRDVVESGVEAETHLREGPAVETITEVANEIGADHIVVGRRGRSALAEALLGSVSRDVLHRARCPVTVVPGGEED